jgi:hypothetical protein
MTGTALFEASHEQPLTDARRDRVSDIRTRTQEERTEPVTKQPDLSTVDAWDDVIRDYPGGHDAAQRYLRGDQ